MATELERLVVRIEADARQLKKELGTVSRKTKEAGDKSAKSFKGFDRQLQNTRRSVLNLKNALIALGLVATIRSFIKAADTMKLLEGRLAVVVKGTSQLAAVQKELFDIAQDTRSAFEDTVILYARVARSAAQLGTSQSELLSITELTQKAIRIGGATTAEASAGVVQFSQALASSRLSGDELRSVLEQMPRLAIAIADGLETDIGTLRALGKAGELTATKVIGAILSQEIQLRKEFELLPRTVGQAFTQLQNQLLVTIGEVDSATGATSDFAEILDEVREIIQSESFKRGLAETAAAFATIAKGIAEAFNQIGESAQASQFKELNSQLLLITSQTEFLKIGLVAAQAELKRLQTERSIIDPFDTAGQNIERVKEEIIELESAIEKGVQKGFKLANIIRDLQLTPEQRDQLSGLTGQDRAAGAVADIGGVELTDKQRKALEDIKDFIAALNEQNASLDLGKTSLAQVAAEEKLLAIAKKGNVEVTQAQIEEAKLLVAIHGDEIAKKGILERLEEQRLDRLEETTEVIDGAKTAEQKLGEETLRLIGFVPDLIAQGFTLGQAMEIVRRNSDEAAKSLGVLADQDDKLTDAQQRVVDGAQDLGLTFTSAFEDAIVEGEALSEVLKGLEKDIIRVLIRKTLTEPITNKISDFITETFKGGGADPGVTGLSTAATAAILPVNGMTAAVSATIAPLTALAAAASAAAGTETAGIVTDVAGGIAGFSGAARGGLIRGAGTGTSDSIGALLSDGEFVVNARAAQANLGILQAINSNSIPRLQAGGQVGSVNNSRSVSIGDINIIANDAQDVKATFSRRAIAKAISRQAQAGGS